MVTMKEALANVDVNELQKLAQDGNDFGLNFYNEKHDKDWEVSPKQMTGIINKLPKITSQTSPAPVSSETDFNYGANTTPKAEPVRVSGTVDMETILLKAEIMEKCHPALKDKDFFKNSDTDGQQKHITTLFLSVK